MGADVDREEFTPGELARFGAALDAGVTALRELLARPGFGDGPATIGAELELDLVDAAGRPAPINRQVLADAVDPRVTLELDRFNLELNGDPLPLAGRPLAALAAQLDAGLAAVRRAAAGHGAEVVTIGILPTLTDADLQPGALTDTARYRALSAGIRRVRGPAFPVRIEGDDVLDVACDDVTFEGANTSFQLHLRVPPDRFARTYNAAQLATGPALAVAGNAPVFLGHRLWEETRIALFRHAVDDRADAAPGDWRPARVSFGHGWVRSGAAELFAESVALHEPLLARWDEEDPVACVRAGGVPRLAPLRLHHGTVWRWNRAVFDPSDGGHVRIELRALPSGPTVTDMVANSALLLGLTLGLADDVDDLLCGLTFGHARHNFYEAARHGLAATLLWPSARGRRAGPIAATALIEALLPVARRGLRAGGVDDDEAARWLDVIAARAATGRTGARFVRAAFDAALRAGDRAAAGTAALRAYQAAAASGAPVHTWPAP